MIENKKNIYINKISIKNIFKNFELPLYVYDLKKIIFNFYILKKIFFFFFFSIKSNDNIFLIKLIKNIFFKFDVVSIGEIEKIIFLSKQKPFILFSGSGKTLSELLISINFNIFVLNIESMQEIFKLYFLLKKNKKKINIMIRINPNIDAKTHKKITTGKNINKFGISIFFLKNLFIINKIINLDIIGYDFHIGSQITTFSPIKKLIRLIFNIYKIKSYYYLNIGGGLGINYFLTNEIFRFSKYYNLIKKKFLYYKINSKIFIELGRYLFSNTCVLLSKINYIKFFEKNIFCILNLGMNDILRPSLYNSFHKIESFNLGTETNLFFGSICESSDKFISKKIKIKNNNLIIVNSSGSYCKTMSNNYNSKKKIFEIIIYKNKIKIIFKMEKFSNLINNYV